MIFPIRLTLIVSFVILPACASRQFTPRATNPVIEDYVILQRSDGRERVAVVSTRADRRVIVFKKDGTMCAEPPPDVAEAILSETALNFSTKAGTSLEYEDGLKTAIQALAGRSKGLIFYRSAVSAACMARINGDIGKEEFFEEIKQARQRAFEIIMAEVEKGQSGDQIPQTLQVSAPTKTESTKESSAIDKSVDK
jgi:hypothetical protein